VNLFIAGKLKGKRISRNLRPFITQQLNPMAIHNEFAGIF